MRGARFSGRREIAIGLAAYAVYQLVRTAVWTDEGRGRARRNAVRILALERCAGLDVERWAQAAALRAPRLVHALNGGYAVFNVGLTVGWLVSLYVNRDPAFHRLRRAAVLAFVGAQPAFLLFPTAPPRALGELVDTLRLSGIDIEHPLLVRLYNPVSAMPSLHLAFAVLTAGMLAERSGTSTGRTAANAYPPLVALVVLATGNHYVLDAVAGAGLGALARRLAG